MIFLHVVLLSANLITFACSSHQSSCDEDCADKPVFTPSQLVVEYGAAASVSCTPCQHGCRQDQAGMDASAGETARNDTAVLWTVDSVAEFNLSATCFYAKDDGSRCCSRLPITVYKPPTRVSLSFKQEEYYSGYESKVQCSVEDVAPIGNVQLIFYSSFLPVFHHQFSDSSVSPESGSYTLTVRSLEESDGSGYWCEANLRLGPEGPATVLKYASKIRRDHRPPPFIVQSSGDR
ncbi:uncharacterized protein LOC115389734 [Salarias fasciatus]|uniref:uncharacterized protein LOC115389734 n=1 Tax=Salarias fasciatus TaxID=181472 RepID=UPI001176D820|nr:uncharacterized protein LOC115389734 [Salarias fasciatus]